eukprot:Gb_14951 [translate_table: standard]
MASILGRLNNIRRFLVSASFSAPASASTSTLVELPKWVRWNSGYASFLGSWKPPKDPRIAKKKLAKLRKDYDKQVKELRKKYWNELEAQRLEEQAKEEAKRERIRLAKEERKASKRQESEMRALERQKQEEEFREMLHKERVERAESRKQKEEALEQRRAKEKDLLHHKSSLWIDEKDLDRRILEAIVDTTPL